MSFGTVDRQMVTRPQKSSITIPIGRILIEEEYNSIKNAGQKKIK